MERIKIKDDGISMDLRDVSRRENTYCRAEDYFRFLADLQPGEIHVSRVIGAYRRGWLYKGPDGIAVKPQSAYAGKENPKGEPFEGIIRWATPVSRDGKTVGYLTMALDHTHVMEFTDHAVPTEQRYSDISDAGSGNYAFLWDDQDQNISHPRDFFICGYDPETGKEVPGWISQTRYDAFLASGLTLEAFVEQLPSFQEFTLKKKGSLQQMREGRISLDCSILDTAPQCEGWHRGTEDGGSGSFLILWSGLWKLTTYAAVPYYTGMFGQSKRGFGYVTIGANVDDFHEAANITQAGIEKTIREQGDDITTTRNQARELIAQSTAKNSDILTAITLTAALAVTAASIGLGLMITRPLKRLNDGALAMGRGELDQHIDVRSSDEIGQLAVSFNQMASAVAAVDRMKSEFVTIASHELRTPIHSMLLGVSGILAGYSGPIDEEVQEDLQIVRDGIQRLRTLVDHLLDLSRIESRKIELKLTRVSMESVVHSAIEELRQLIESNRHEIVPEIPADLPEIVVDERRITQVVINLLSNAIKYTPPNGKILISAKRMDEEIHFSIADNGYGIPEWAHDKVFEKFFQADSIMSQKVGGSGLGLTISRGIVEEHGGAMELTSPLSAEQFPDLSLDDERKGTVITVRLPLSRP
jgi:signal transduction histidine kinase